MNEAEEKGYKYLVEMCFWKRKEKKAQRSSGDSMLDVVKNSKKVSVAGTV